MSDDKPKIEIVEPTVGEVPLAGPPTIRIVVKVQSKVKVLGALAEVYRERAPKEPKHKLAPTDRPGVYKGEIPALDGPFSIRVLTKLEGGASETYDQRGYEGVRLASAASDNQVEIDSPVPPERPDMTADGDFEVIVSTSGSDTVAGVRARGVDAGGETIGTEVILAQDLGSGKFTGTIRGSTTSAFHVVARGFFDDGSGSQQEVPRQRGPYG